MANSLYRLCKELHKNVHPPARASSNKQKYKDLQRGGFGLAFAPMPHGRIGSPHGHDPARSSRRTQGGGTARPPTHGTPPVLPFIRNRSPGREWPRPGDGFHLRRAAQTVSAGGAVIQIEIRATKFSFPRITPTAPGASPQVPGAS